MIEKTIISNLIFNDEYTRKCIPFLKAEYFSDLVEKKLFQAIAEYHEKYNLCPSQDALAIEVSNTGGMSDELAAQADTYIKELKPSEEKDTEWVVDSTEKFCQEKAVYNAIMDGIQILDGQGKEDKGALPQMLSDALSVSFDNHIGHDFIEDANERFDFYQKKEVKIPFDIDYLNRITQGGLARKTLNIAMAGTGVGKSPLYVSLCSC